MSDKFCVFRQAKPFLPRVQRLAVKSSIHTVQHPFDQLKKQKREGACMHPPASFNICGIICRKALPLYQLLSRNTPKKHTASNTSDIEKRESGRELLESQVSAMRAMSVSKCTCTFSSLTLSDGRLKAPLMCSSARPPVIKNTVVIMAPY